MISFFPLRNRPIHALTTELIVKICKVTAIVELNSSFQSVSIFPIFTELPVFRENRWGSDGRRTITRKREESPQMTGPLIGPQQAESQRAGPQPFTPRGNHSIEGFLHDNIARITHSKWYQALA